KVPARLDAVRGGLQVIQLNRPALVLRQCVAYISQRLIGDDAVQPDWRSMDTLADAITSVEYYLERLSDEPDTSDDILELARDRMAALGFALEDAVVGEPDDVVEVVDITVDAVPADATGTAPRVADAPAPEMEFALDDDAHSDTIEALDALGGEGFEVSEDDEELPPLTTASAAGARDDDNLIDDEIIESFVEEAGEVLDALNTYFPRWAMNQHDQEALVEFRRAFHTLKGSGRMVGAGTVGELAWSIENMMNRVIDN